MYVKFSFREEKNLYSYKKKKKPTRPVFEIRTSVINLVFCHASSKSLIFDTSRCNEK